MKKRFFFFFQFLFTTRFFFLFSFLFVFKNVHELKPAHLCPPAVERWGEVEVLARVPADGVLEAAPHAAERDGHDDQDDSEKDPVELGKDGHARSNNLLMHRLIHE